MTALVAILVVLAVTGSIVWPLLQDHDGSAEAAEAPAGDELWKREKAVAVLAITEADFDRATGKLSDDDYQELRSDYEGRALQAMDQLDRFAALESAPAPEGAFPAFCGACGKAFGEQDAFCAGCGRPRHPA
jgi:hypothetical protein